MKNLTLQLLILSFPLFSCSDEGNSKASIPVNPETRANSGQPLDVDPNETIEISGDSFLYKFSPCLKGGPSTTIEAMLFEGKNQLSQIEIIPVEFGQNQCVKTAKLSFPDLRMIDSSKQYEVQIAVSDSQRLRKLIKAAVSFKNSENDTPTNPIPNSNLWPNEVDQAPQGKCLIGEVMKNCQKVIEKLVSSMIKNPALDGLVYFHASNFEDLDYGYLMLTPDQANNGKSGTYTFGSGLHYGEPYINWATHSGFNNSKYVIRGGRLALLSADGKKAAYFTITELNGRLKLMGEIKGVGFLLL